MTGILIITNILTFILCLLFLHSNSEKTLRMLKPGGTILWHDYRGPREVPDVYKALGELGKKVPLAHIGGSSLVAYRRQK
jgi:hypothetical protein